MQPLQCPPLRCWGAALSTCMPRHVRGSFFSDYVRMMRRRKDVDWSEVLWPEDLQYLHARVERDQWYPMASFERMGVAILEHVPGATLDAVRFWGRVSAAETSRDHQGLIVEGEAVETLMRLKVLRATFFDFPAFDLPTLAPGNARVVINYHMGRVAEEAACHQTAGFCEGALNLAGAANVQAVFDSCAWKGAPTTLLDLSWDV